MTLWQRYLRPTKLDHALEELVAAAPESRVIAGGTDLLLDMQQGREAPVGTLVDVSGIEELAGIYFDDDWLMIGAAATHHQIITNEIIKEHAQCVAEACSLIGGPQVRNVATLGGNVAHGLPAADGTISLLAMEAEAEIASAEGRQWHPLEELFTGPGETSFDRGRQVLVRFRLPLDQAHTGSAFARVMRPQGVAIAILNMAAWLKVDEAGQVIQARLAVGPTGPRPRRTRTAEEYLVGRRPDGSIQEQLHQLILQGSSLRTSRHRATKEYRQQLVRVLVERTIPAAYERANN